MREDAIETESCSELVLRKTNEMVFQPQPMDHTKNGFFL
jgi:hypothetical protein